MLGLSLFEHVDVFREDLARACVHGEGAPLTLLGLSFRNRVGVAGGLDKNGTAPLALGALGFGFVEVGTVTAIAQAENPPPNLFRLPKDRALVNRLGFPNEGAPAVAARLASKKEKMQVPLAVSIGKSRVVDASDLDAVVADYLASFDAVRGVADFVVVNVSSPNTKNLRSLQGDHAARLLEALASANRRGRERPLLLKIAPDLEDASIGELAARTMASGFSGIVATNTSVARAGLATPESAVVAIGQGGLSGAPIFERATRVVRIVREAAGREAVIIGVGGIESGARAAAMVAAGADLLQLYTGLVYEGPALVQELVAATAAPGGVEGRAGAAARQATTAAQAGS